MTIDTSMKDVLDPAGGSATIVDAAGTVVSRIAAIEGAKGAANGLASLNSSGRLAQTVDGANVNQDSTHRFATDTEKATWSGKQDAITTGTAAQYLKGDLSLGTFASDVRDAILTGLSTATNAAITATDSVLSAFGKLQAQVSSRFLKAGDTLTGTGGNGFFGAIKQSSKPSTPSDGFRLYADSSGRLSWIGENGYVRTFDGTANTADRVYTLPNNNGTVQVLLARDTAANINANYDPTTYNGCVAVATDLGNPGIGVELIAANGAWRVKSPGIVNFATAKLVPSNWYINCNPSGATYSQSGTTLTLTWTSHGIPNNLNGANIYLAPSSGTATSGWYSNIAVVDANTITCTASASRSTSGNIGSNSVETYLPTLITFPSFLIRAGVVVNFSGFHWAKTGASTKSAKLYAFGSYSGTANLTTSGQITAIGIQGYGQGLRFSTDTNFYFNSLTSIMNYTVTDMTLKFSSTCATANDWHAICTEWITYSGA